MSKKGSPIRYIPVILVFISGLISSCFLFWIIRSQENHRIQNDFNSLASDRLYVIQKSLNNYFEILNSIIANFHILKNNVDREQFRLMVQYALQRQRDIQVLAWIPRVPVDKRDEFEMEGIKEGLPDFQITERNFQKKKIIRAGHREVYFPLRYFEPFYVEDYKGERPNLGFDYASEKVLREAMEKARDENSVSITEKMHLSFFIRGNSHQHGCALFMPVFEWNKPHFTVKERRLYLKGFVVCVFNIEKMVEESLNSLKPVGIDCYLLDETSLPIPDKQILCFYNSHTRRIENNPLAINYRNSKFKWKKSFQVGLRTWSLICSPTPQFLLDYSHSGPWIILSLSMAFTLLVSGYIYNILHRNEKIELLVAKRTAQLSEEIKVRKIAEASLKEREELLSTIMNSVQTGIMLIDAESLETVDINQVTAKLIGRSREEILGRKCFNFSCLKVKDKCPVIENGKLSERMEDELINAEGKTISIIKSVNMITRNGQRFIVESFMDISEQKELEEKLRVLSLIDELTSLYNRRGFFTLAEQEIKRAKRTKSPLLLIFLDLDGLKGINDNLGHQEGDQALRETTTILKNTFRHSDIIARIGGDEFAVLALNSNLEKSEAVLKRLQENLNEFNRKGKYRFKLSLSSGVVSFDPESPCNIDELLARADSKMYAQKKKRYSPAL